MEIKYFLRCEKMLVFILLLTNITFLHADSFGKSEAILAEESLEASIERYIRNNRETHLTELLHKYPQYILVASRLAEKQKKTWFVAMVVGKIYLNPLKDLSYLEL